MDINSVVLVGRLTRDPEVRDAGKSRVASIGLAVNRVFYKGEEKQEETTFFNVEVWGSTADVVEKFCKKGSEIGIQGRLQNEEWNDKESGEKRTRTKIVGERVSLGKGPGGSKEDGGSEGGEAPAPRARKSFAKKGEGKSF